MELGLYLLAFVAAWGVAYVLGRLRVMSSRGVTVKPFFLMYKTSGLNRLLDMVCWPKRFWRNFATFSVFLGLALVSGALAFLLSNLMNFFLQPLNFSELAILVPGLTIQSPMALLYFFVSIPIILAIHEGSHALVAKVEKIPIKSGGFAILGVLVAGFVEPDEHELKRSRAISRAKVVAAGSSANVLFSVAIAAVLLTTPALAVALPDPIRHLLYHDPAGVEIAGVVKGGPADLAGIRAGDVLAKIKDRSVRSPADLSAVSLLPDQLVDITVLRKARPQVYILIAQRQESGRGMVGIYPAAAPYYLPILPLLEIPKEVVGFLFWLWFLSFNIGVFNMLPLYPLDGEAFVASLLGARVPEQRMASLRRGISVATFAVLAANLIMSYLRTGISSV